MRERTEAELVRALKEAGDSAPEPLGDLAGDLARRRRLRSRRRFQMALAAAGVVAVIGAGTTVVTNTFTNRGDEGAMTMVETPAPAATTSVPKAKPAAELWPAAVSTMPAKAADGWKYRPVTALNATEILLTAESSFEKAGRLEIWDTAAKKSTILGDMPEPEGVRGYFAQNVEAGDDHIVWFGETPNDDTAWADLWTMPRSGGSATRIGELTGEAAAVDQIAVTKEHVVWSVTSGGVYRMPITGGSPEKLAGTEGLHLIDWPWAGDVQKYDDWEKNQTLLVNVETGERLTPQVPDGVKGLRCSPEWCTGRAGEDMVVQRVDGSERTTLRETAGDQSAVRSGRFIQIPSGVYDLTTGQAAEIGATSEDGKVSSVGSGISSSPGSVYYWQAGTLKTKKTCKTLTKEQIEQMDLPENMPTAKPGGQSCSDEIVGEAEDFVVLNLAAVPPAE
ncbi:hypothetical protein [Streptosporangium sp. KLBMP 9127]|nr:hypothetical protein [Streptosporangium sp. KLBMP 9127]